MTEQEWLTSENPKAMLVAIQEGATDRKRRLFAVTGCRLIWPQLLDERSRWAVEVAERFTEGLAGTADLEDAADEADGVVWDYEVAMRAKAMADQLEPFELRAGGRPRTSRAAAESVVIAVTCPVDCAHLVEELTSCRWGAEFRNELVSLIRDIFGNPFRPVTAEPSWLTPTAVALADAIYADRAFDRLPVLADALEEAGCDHLDVLAHCRSESQHVRGCWVVDLVLRKS